MRGGDRFTHRIGDFWCGSSEAHGFVEQCHTSGEILFILPPHGDEDFDTWPTQFFRRNEFHINDEVVLIPNRTHPEQREDLPFHHAKVTHRFHAIEVERDLLRLAGAQQFIDQLACRFPGGARWNLLGVE